VKKVLIGIGLTVAALAGLAWYFQQQLLLFAVTRVNRMDVGPNQPIAWQRGPEAPDLPVTGRPPNIIFILADDLGMNDISTFGGGVAGGRVPTPNIDRLASSGASFTQAYAGNATCAPSRAMLMTGRYPTRHGFEFTPTPPGMGRVVPTLSNAMETGLPNVEWNRQTGAEVPSMNQQGLPGSEVTIAEVLRDTGYHTVHIGKWHLGLGEEFGPNAQGFAESLLMANGLFLPEDHPDVVNAKLDFDPIDRFLWARMQYAASYNEGPIFEPGGYLTDWWTDESLEVIEANRHRPFFLYLAHWAVHTPLQATREDYEAVGDIEPHRLRVYAAMVRSLDRSVGRILDKLEDEGLAENTIIVFSSDNGGAGYIGIDDVNAPYRGWKITFFEGGIRAPLFIRWPARIDAGTEVRAPVAHIDVMPTLAAAAGAPLPADVTIDGVDLLPAATGTGEVARPGDALFWQSGYYQVVRRGDWKLQVNHRQQKQWLFDLANDPTEQVDLAAERPEVVAELAAVLAAHRSGAREPLYPYVVESPVAIDRTRAERVEPGDEFIYWPN